MTFFGAHQTRFFAICGGCFCFSNSQRHSFRFSDSLLFSRSPAEWFFFENIGSFCKKKMWHVFEKMVAFVSGKNGGAFGKMMAFLEKMVACLGKMVAYF